MKPTPNLRPSTSLSSCARSGSPPSAPAYPPPRIPRPPASETAARSEEHTSELQSQSNLVCRLLLEKKKKTNSTHARHTYTLESSNAVTTRVRLRPHLA